MTKSTRDIKALNCGHTSFFSPTVPVTAARILLVPWAPGHSGKPVTQGHQQPQLVLLKAWSLISSHLYAARPYIFLLVPRFCCGCLKEIV